MNRVGATGGKKVGDMEQQNMDEMDFARSRSVKQCRNKVGVEVVAANDIDLPGNNMENGKEIGGGDGEEGAPFWIGRTGVANGRSNDGPSSLLIIYNSKRIYGGAQSRWCFEGFRGEQGKG